MVLGQAQGHTGAAHDQWRIGDGLAQVHQVGVVQRIHNGEPHASRTQLRDTRPDGLWTLPHDRMADQAEEIERRVAGRDRELTGPLRVTTAFVVMEHLLPEPLADFARAYPGIEVEVVENAFLVDLSRRHADESASWSRR